MRYSLSLGVIATSFASTVVAKNCSKSWDVDNFKSLVVFGDSYSDESRLGYFINNNGSAPPVGWVQPENLKASSGGRIWGRYVKQYTGVNFYNYAVSGAVCSNAISPRTFSAINAPFPAVTEYEVPAFIADSQYTPANGTKFLDVPADETVYAIWIGTNDLGNYAFLTDSQVQGKTLVDFVDCVYDNIEALYTNGGRKFVLMNLAPLELLPQYSTPENGGQARTRFWPDKSGNITEISYRILEDTKLVNSIYDYRTPYEIQISHRFPEAQFAVFNTNGLLTDIWTNPSSYLNGTAPLNVTGWNNQCDAEFSNCADSPNPDGFMWYDELHPSEQTGRIVAQEFVKVVEGESKWATYWSK